MPSRDSGRHTERMRSRDTGKGNAPRELDATQMQQQMHDSKKRGRNQESPPTTEYERSMQKIARWRIEDHIVQRLKEGEKLSGDDREVFIRNKETLTQHEIDSLAFRAAGTGNPSIQPEQLPTEEQLKAVLKKFNEEIKKDIGQNTEGMQPHDTNKGKARKRSERTNVTKHSRDIKPGNDQSSRQAIIDDIVAKINDGYRPGDEHNAGLVSSGERLSSAEMTGMIKRTKDNHLKMNEEERRRILTSLNDQVDRDLHTRAIGRK